MHGRGLETGIDNLRVAAPDARPGHGFTGRGGVVRRGRRRRAFVAAARGGAPVPVRARRLASILGMDSGVKPDEPRRWCACCAVWAVLLVRYLVYFVCALLRTSRRQRSHRARGSGACSP